MRHLAIQALGTALLSVSLAGGMALAQSSPMGHPSPMNHASHMGHRATTAGAPVLSLQAQASREIPQDLIRITLAADHEHAQSAEVGRLLNAALEATLAEARAAGDWLTVRTGSYQVFPQSQDKGQIRSWRGRAELILESGDKNRLGELAGRLARRMPVAQVQFLLSDAARAAEETRLLGEASKAFHQRAQAAAQAFGFARYELRELGLDGAGVVMQPAPRALMRADAAMMAASPVPMEPGTTQVTVTVTGSVHLLR